VEEDFIMDENYIPKKEGYKTLVHWCDSCKNKDECKAGYEKKEDGVLLL